MSKWKNFLDDENNEQSTQNIPAQIPEEEETSVDNEIEETEQVADKRVEKEPAAKTADKVYFDYCHNYVFHVQATRYLLKIGLYKYIDDLRIGYDTETKEIIFPLDDTHYYSIQIENNYALDEKYAKKVIGNRFAELKKKRQTKC